MAESFGVTEATFTFDKLLADNQPMGTKGVTVLSGEGAITRGMLLGKITASTIPAPTLVPTTNANGTITTPTAGRFVQSGTYVIRCIEAETDLGQFNVIAPDGYSIGTAKVGVAFTSDHINFTISDGSNNFVVGDKFTCAISGTGKYQVYNSANVDGSGNPRNVVIASMAGDATSADWKTTAYTNGVFNSAALTGYAAADEAALNDIGIYIKTNQSVA